MHAIASEGTEATPDTTPGTMPDPTRNVIDALKKSLTDLDGYSISDMTDDIELAELIGRLKSLAGVLVSIVDR